MVGKKHSRMIVSIVCLRVIFKNTIRLFFFHFLSNSYWNGCILLLTVEAAHLVPRFCLCRRRQIRLESVHQFCSLLHMRTRVPLVQTTLKQLHPTVLRITEAFTIKFSRHPNPLGICHRFRITVPLFLLSRVCCPNANSFSKSLFVAWTCIGCGTDRLLSLLAMIKQMARPVVIRCISLFMPPKGCAQVEVNWRRSLFQPGNF